MDAVIYGEGTHYDAYYAFLISAWQVGADVKMVSTHTGEELYSVSGDCYSVDGRPAFDPMDIVINSGLSLLELRDITLARAEEEEARGIVLRIPRSEKLKSQLIELTRDRQGELEFAARTNSNSAAADGGDFTAPTARNSNYSRPNSLQ